MTKEQKLLQDVGRALFGVLWQTELSDHLGVAPRTVRRWLAGTNNIPEGVWVDIAKLCKTRGADLTAWAKQLEA